ncbi:hypothetical protein Hanom_Chr01g00039601 [Helianthus anomalus]
MWRSIRYEARHYFPTWKLQQPKRVVSETEIDPEMKKPKVSLIYKRPKAMNNMSLMRMEQDFQEDFRWWHYYKQTGEAMIVLCNNGNWRTIRILDPMWIVNMLQKDIEMLFYNKIYYPVEDMVQAMQYQQVIKVCYAYDIHSRRMWESKWRDLELKC